MADLSIGIVGLENRGIAMAEALQNAGFQVLVHDFHAQAMQFYGMKIGGNMAPTAGYLAKTSDVVFLTRTAPEAARQAIGGSPDFLSGLDQDDVVVDMSHASPLQAQALARALAPKGTAYVDAPAVAHAGGGEMLLVGGAERGVTRAWPALEALGMPLLRTGAVGTGQAARALIAAGVAVNLLGATEALIAAKRFGLAPNLALEALDGSLGASRAGATLAASTAGTAPNSGYRFTSLAGDLAHFLEMARETSSPAPLAALAGEIWRQAGLNLEAPQDHGDVVRWLESAAKTRLHGDGS